MGVAVRMTLGDLSDGLGLGVCGALAWRDGGGRAGSGRVRVKPVVDASRGDVAQGVAKVGRTLAVAVGAGGWHVG